MYCNSQDDAREVFGAARFARFGQQLRRCRAPAPAARCSRLQAMWALAGLAGSPLKPSRICRQVYLDPQDKL